MYPDFVALDLETTGLDAQRHAIIEIAAVRFVQGEPVDRWSTLVHPGQPIPPQVTEITGIHDDMVADAPDITQVLPKLRAFVGNRLLVGHNLRDFDLPFLNLQGLFAQHPIADTLAAAQVLLPRAAGYSLPALARELNLPVQPVHRALEDAEAAGWLFLRLCDLAAELPQDLLRRLLQWAGELQWPGTPVLQWGLQHHRGPKRVPIFAGLAQAAAQEDETPATRPADLPHPLESPAFFGPDGPLARILPAYEYRVSQQAMAEVVAEALTRGEHLMVEAGTGTGKSLAYLLPAALWAGHMGEPVLIATHTKALQDQLLAKDIPLLRQALAWPELRAVTLKGRRNYLCPRRLQDMLRTGPRDEDTFRVLGRVLVWLVQGGTGEADDLTLQSRDEFVWRQLNAEDEGCTARTCAQRMEGLCPFYRTRKAAQEAHLVVVNHALLMQDVLAGYRVLPKFSRLIIDEAHHLEAAATDALTQEASTGTWRTWMRELGHQQKGLLGRLLFFLQKWADPADVVQARRLVQGIVERAFAFQEALKALEGVFLNFLDARYPRRASFVYDLRIRLTPDLYAAPWWQEVQRTWLDARARMRALLARLEQLALFLQRYLDREQDEDLAETLQDMLARLQTLHAQAQALRDHFQALFVEGELRQEEEVHWIEWRPRSKQLAWIRAPRRVDDLLREHLWSKKESAVLTSATLRVAGTFAFLQARLGLEDARTLALPSPFDYPNQALVYVVRDAPPPKGPNHAAFLARALLPLVRDIGGRTLVLFTSYRHMNEVARALRPGLEAAGIRLLLQEEGQSVRNLVRAFRQAQPAVLMGTRSLWEGIDIPGDDLSLLVLSKLPFAVPDDPLHAARAEMYQDPFEEYSLPDAVLAFLQGFGRLIRTRTDRGAVVIFDPRVLTRGYGRVFLQSLPRCRMLSGPWHRLHPVVVDWLRRDGIG